MNAEHKKIIEEEFLKCMDSWEEYLDLHANALANAGLYAAANAVSSDKRMRIEAKFDGVLPFGRP